MLLYIDDILITGFSLTLNAQFLCNLKSEFPVKDIGPLYYFHGILVHRKSISITLKHCKYIFHLLPKTDLSEAKGYLIPCPLPYLL